MSGDVKLGRIYSAIQTCIERQLKMVSWCIVKPILTGGIGRLPTNGSARVDKLPVPPKIESWQGTSLRLRRSTCCTRKHGKRLTGLVLRLGCKKDDVYPVCQEMIAKFAS